MGGANRSLRQDPSLDDGAPARQRVPEGVIELERDQEGHDRAKDRLEHHVVERVQGLDHERVDHCHNQPVERDDDDGGDHPSEHHRDQHFEALVTGQGRETGPSCGTMDSP